MVACVSAMGLVAGALAGSTIEGAIAGATWGLIFGLIWVSPVAFLRRRRRKDEKTVRDAGYYGGGEGVGSIGGGHGF